MYMLIIFVGFCIIWTVYLVTNKSSKKTKEEAHGSDNAELRIKIPGIDNPVPKKPDIPKTAQESLDSLYAKSNGMWVCRHCETLNDGMAPYCVACGADK